MKPKYHPHLDSLSRISQQRRGRYNKLRLDSNELAPNLGAEIFEEILAAITPDHFSAYPEIEECYEVLSNYLQVPSANLLLSNGSEAAIRQVFEIFCGQDPLDEALILSPTYGMYGVYASIYNAKVVEVFYDESFNISIDKVINKINHNTKIVAIANPNGAIGTLVCDQDLLCVAEAAGEIGAVLLLDEAHYHFGDFSPWPEYAQKLDNVFLIRTLSKAGGLAGLRYGYLVTNQHLRNILWKTKPIYELNSISALAGNYLLSQPGKLKAVMDNIKDNKANIVKELQDIGYIVYPGHANFFLVRVGNNANQIKQVFLQHDVCIKTYSPDSFLTDYIRVAVGTENSMSIVLDIFKQLKNLSLITI